MDNQFVAALGRWLQLYDRKDVKSAFRLRDVCMIELIDETVEEEESEETYTFTTAAPGNSARNILRTMTSSLRAMESCVMTCRNC